MKLHRTLLTSAVLLLAGCNSLPDTQPFTDATVSLRSAVASSGTVVVGELKAGPVAGVKAQASNFETAWETRNAAMSAFVDYANSLQAIVDSGVKGEAAAGKVADAASTLAGSVGLGNVFASEAAGLARDAVKFIYGQIAQARAAKSLKSALVEVQPAIERVARLLMADLKDSDQILTAATKAQLDALEEDNQREISFRRVLLARRGEWMSSIANQLNSQGGAGKKPTEVAGVQELDAVIALLEKSDSWNGAYEQQRAKIIARSQAAHDLIDAANQAMPDWAAAHGKLLAAVTARHAPSVAELTAVSTRIRDLVDRYRQLTSGN